MRIRVAVNFVRVLFACLILLATLNCSEEQKPRSEPNRPAARSTINELAARSNPSGLKVLLVGIDGATFRVINPLIADGKLPLIQKLMESGAHGILESTVPMASPALWTSMATGRSREAHGIESFTSKTGSLHKVLDKMGIQKAILVGSNDRKVTALWNWMGPFGLTTGFCGWWATWPAEEVNGWLISDRVTRNRFAEWEEMERTERLTYSPDLINELRPLIIDPENPPLEEIKALVELTEEELTELANVSKPIYGHWLSVFKFAWCAQRSYEKFVMHMLKKDQPDLTGVFLIANDPVSHTFWHFYQPDEFEDIDPEKAKRLGKLIPNIWRHNDRFLAELLAKVDPNTVVIIVSDHGFESSGEIPKPITPEQYDTLKEAASKSGMVAVGQSGKHHLEGVLIACGPSIKKGIQVKAHIHDLAPTILALLGLPVPEDLEGRVLTEMIDEEFFARYPIQTIRSFEDYLERKTVAVSEDVNEEDLLENLRALGYVK